MQMLRDIEMCNIYFFATANIAPKTKNDLVFISRKFFMEWYFDLGTFTFLQETSE
jgi:hypothetical protein